MELTQLIRLLLPSMANVGRMSLSGLTEAFCGAPLDKSQQCSNWTARPLSKEQVAYAAADAHVLTAIYDAVLAGSPVQVHRGLLQAVSSELKRTPVQ